MSEAELHQIQVRLHQGERQKAARGELRISLPAGLIQNRDGGVTFNPDEEAEGTSADDSPTTRRMPMRRDLEMKLRGILGTPTNAAGTHRPICLVTSVERDDLVHHAQPREAVLLELNSVHEAVSWGISVQKSQEPDWLG